MSRERFWREMFGDLLQKWIEVISGDCKKINFFNSEKLNTILWKHGEGDLA